MTAAPKSADISPLPIRPPLQTSAAGELQTIPLTDLHESPWNPRKHFDAAKLAETAESLRTNGQLTPITVRARKGGGYEIGAGHRRFRAAPLAGLRALLAVVRPLDDVAFLELLTIENKQREDVTPLDEAAGFKLLMEKAGYDVAKLAARIGLSAKYVYDRLKLLQLVPAARKLLEDGTITAGHAILIARLTPKDQKRVMGDGERANRYSYESSSLGGLFQAEYADYDSDQPGLQLKDAMKARSVRELAQWINDHVRFRPEENDLPNLFPAAAAALAAAKEEELKIVWISYDRQLKYDAKDNKVRTYGVASWHRADGKKGSKKCEHSVIGVVAAGPDRGDAFHVCVNREKCGTHFAAAKAKLKRRRQLSAKLKEQGVEDPYERDRQIREAEDAKRKQRNARWKKAAPALLKALAEKIRALPAGTGSAIGRHALDQYGQRRDVLGSHKVLPPGRSAEDLLRHLVFADVVSILEDDWGDLGDSVQKEFKPWGIDARKIVDQVVPATAAAPVRKGKGK